MLNNGFFVVTAKEGGSESGSQSRKEGERRCMLVFVLSISICGDLNFKPLSSQFSLAFAVAKLHKNFALLCSFHSGEGGLGRGEALRSH